MSGSGKSSSKAAVLNPGSAKGLLNRSQVTSGRLPSLKPTRDLTLSQPSSTAKRTFVPNVKAKKETLNGSTSSDNKASVSATSTQSPKVEHKKRDDRKGKNEKPRKFEYVQSYSMFAEGLAAGKSQKTANSRAFAHSAGGSSFKDKDEPPVKQEAPEYVVQQKAEKKQSGYFISDLKEGDIEPIRLPFRVKDKKSIKQEAMEVDDVDTPQTELSVSLDLPETAAVALASSASNQEYFLFQLPDVLPEVNAKLEADDAADLSQWPEGEIGTLQFLDTGQIRLMVSGSTFSVGLGADVCHLQDLMLFDQNGTDNTGQMTRLGHLDKKLVCVPDLDDLIEKLGGSGRKDPPS